MARKDKQPKTGKPFDTADEGFDSDVAQDENAFFLLKFEKDPADTSETHAASHVLQSEETSSPKLQDSNEPVSGRHASKDQPVEPFAGQPAELFAEQPAELFPEPPSGQPVKPPSGQPVELIAEPFAKQPVEPFSEQSILQSAEPPAAQSVELPVVLSAEPSAVPSVELPVEKPAEQSTEKPAAQTTARHVAVKTGEQQSTAQGKESASERGAWWTEEPDTESGSNDSIPVPRGFEPIPEEKLTEAKRTRHHLLVVIIILIVVLVGGLAAGTYYYFNYVQAGAQTTQDPTAIDQAGTVIDDRGVIATVEMPNLAQMFGQTPDQILAVLGSDYAITNTDTNAIDQTAPDTTTDTTGTTDTSTTATTDENTATSNGTTTDTTTDTTATGSTAADSVATQVVTISYMPTTGDSTSMLRQTQKIYLTLNGSGVTIGVYFVSSMDILDFPSSTFADLVATNDSFVKSLTAAGVMVSPDTEYTVPSPEDFTVYVDPAAEAKKLRKETTTWKGNLVSDVAPTSFEITYTFDYGASGVDVSSGTTYPSQRMLYIQLS